MKRVSLAVSVFGVVVCALAVSGVAGASGGGGLSSGCIAHHPNTIAADIWYTAGCTGHDEPELDPVSGGAGSARDLTWTAVLPSNGSFDVEATGPTFWFGGTVTDPHSLFGQAFVELQFYPNSILHNCTSNGGFVVAFAADTYTACSPVWRVISTGGTFVENAAFNAMLVDGAGTGPLVMHAGDTITVHWFTTPAADGFHVTVTDVTTGHAGTIVLDSAQDGPLMPAFDTQSIGNALGWGLVDDTPNSFVWEIGHTGEYANPPDAFCLPGDTKCFSYDAPAWAGTSPIQIKSVTFADGSAAKKWAAVSDFGGKAEVNQYCGAANYGSPFCIYPWYTLGTTGFHYGVDFPDTKKDFGQADQFAQTMQCGGPFGADSTYCDTILK